MKIKFLALRGLRLFSAHRSGVRQGNCKMDRTTTQSQESEVGFFFTPVWKKTPYYTHFNLKRHTQTKKVHLEKYVWCKRTKDNAD